MANGIYEGGIPNSGTSLFPSSTSDQVAVGETPGGGGQGRIDARPGTPPTMNNSYASQTSEVNSFLDSESYQGNMSVDNEPSMVIRNPDDLSHADSGKMP